jgi:hypothetical protein
MKRSGHCERKVGSGCSTVTVIIELEAGSALEPKQLLLTSSVLVGPTPAPELIVSPPERRLFRHPLTLPIPVHSTPPLLVTLSHQLY